MAGTRGKARSAAAVDEPLSPTGTAADDPEWPPGTFEQTCLKIIRQNLNPMFGAEIIYFDRPVDLKYVPDYYKVTRCPMSQPWQPPAPAAVAACKAVLVACRW